MELAEAAYRIARKLPPEERLGLASQMKRAATSVPLNLAEGYGRGGREFVRFIGIAYGSPLELETQVELARRLQLVREADAEALLHRTAELGRILNGLRRSLVASLERKPDPRIRETAERTEVDDGCAVAPARMTPSGLLYLLFPIVIWIGRQSIRGSGANKRSRSV